METGFLQNDKGNKSSKRLWGSISLSNGILLKNGQWFCGFFNKAISVDQISYMQQASSSLITIGCLLLGLGLGESLHKIFKRK